MRNLRAPLPVLLLLAAACRPPAPQVRPTAPPPAAELPTGRLPTTVKPLAYTLELVIRPGLEGFSGRTQIAVEVAEPTRRIWLHGLGLEVTQAAVIAGQDRLPASYRQVDDNGLSQLTVETPVAAGQAILELSYNASFDRQLAGLYKVIADGEPYAFTQFEPYSARKAFPCFDEPVFKTSFDIWLTVEEGHRAITNTPLLGSEPSPGGTVRLHFEQTKPLPTYLVAFAVGPLDIVEAPPIPPNDVRDRPLPFRGAAVKGKGPQLAYALEHTPPLLAELERYFGLPYPYAKLDVIAVPDFGAGAMENAGAITFREWLLLLDEETAPEGQRRAFAQVMAHELAHHWFGNLVTMPWWDDIWLNEAFATWMGHRVVREVHPGYQSEVDLLSAAHRAMAADSRQSARRIRQPIETTHDITSAFDSITYSKGAAVLGMFERYLGAETFRKGIAQHLGTYAYGVADSDALLASLSEAAGQDVATPLRGFLDQVGVPLIEAELTCEGAPTLRLSQSRYLPAGSPLRSEARTEGHVPPRWQVPVCARFEARGKQDVACTLLRETEGSLSLGTHCPRWVMPNADGVGYYHFSLAAADLERLRRRGFTKLSQPEKVALIQSMEAGFESGQLPLPEMFASFDMMVADRSPAVASAPMGLLEFARERLLPPELVDNFEQKAGALYAPLLRRLGFKERKGEDAERSLLRAEVAGFLATVVRDPSVRARLSEMGKALMGYGGDGELHMEAAPAELRGVALQVALAEGDEAMFQHAYQLFTQTKDAVARDLLLDALSRVRDARSERALALALDPAVRGNEVLGILHGQLSDERTREAAFHWLQENFDAVRDRLSGSAAGSTPWTGVHFCDEASAQRVEAFFAPRVQALPGGPRNLAGVLEAIRLCAAQAAIHKAAAEAYFN